MNPNVKLLLGQEEKLKDPRRYHRSVGILNHPLSLDQTPHL